MKKCFCALLLVLANGIVMAQLVINNVVVESPQCHALCNGSLSISASGTSGPYQYSVDGGVTYSSQNFLSSLCAGTYDIWVHDPLLSLYADTTVVMTEPALLDINSFTSDVVCNGDCDGSASVAASGGTVGSGYMYSWTYGPTTPAISGLCPGSYECTVSDDNECSDSITLVISEPSALVFTIDAQNVSCHGGSDGVINFMDGIGNSGAFGGTPFANGGYDYSIDEGQTYHMNSQFSNLTAGLYGLIVQDSLGCIASSSHTILEPAPINFSVTSSNPTACNVADGYLVFSGLTQDSTYILSGLNQYGDTLPPVTQMADQSGQIVVDSIGTEQLSDFTIQLNACSAYLDTIIYLVAPTNGFAINTSSALVSDASCANTDGSITGITVSGGTGPGTYTYHYTGGSSTLDLLNAQPGSYVLTVSDTNGCVIESNPFTINSTISNITLSSSSSPASCHGSCDGAIELSASGGDGNYSYTCSNGMQGDSLSNVCAGTFTVSVIDGLGCQGIDIVTILEPTAISNTISSVAPSCGSNNGSAEVTASTGGVLPYSYQWSNGSTSALADSLLAGVYLVTVTDDNLCVTIETVNITSNAGPIITSNIIDASCNGGNDGGIDLMISGGTAPYTIDWSTGEHTEDISGLAAGIYDVTIFDDAGCGVVQVFSVSEPMPIDLSIAAITNASCGIADGMISVSALGGAGGYNYLWSSGSTTADATNLTAGTYSLSVSDNNGCMAINSYSVSNVTGPSIAIDQVIQPVCQGGSGEILVSVTGGTLPYSYAWSSGANSEDLFNAPVGSYELVVTDSAGCQAVEYLELDGINFNAAEICMVTVDTTTGANVVVWNKENNLGISEYEVHKETSSLNVFQLLGTVPFDSLSQFIDTAANSSVHSYRYKLRTIDSCGNFSEFLAYHKTIHLVSNIGLNNTVNLVWDDYIGFDYLTFYINRYHPTTGWEVLDSVAANIHSYTDSSYPSLAGLEYDIEVIPTFPCLAEKAQDHNTTRSNRHTIAPPNANAIDELTLLNARVQPNPSNGLFSIFVETSNWSYSILDMNGKLILNETVSNNNAEVNIETLEAGIYMLQISAEDQSIHKKIVKQ